jgi:hypothetical protein
LEAEVELRRRHAHAVVNNPDQLGAASRDLEHYAAGASVKAVLHQLLDH